MTIPTFLFRSIYIGLTYRNAPHLRHNMALRVASKRAGAFTSIGRVAVIEPRASRRHASAAAVPASNLSNDAQNEIQVCEIDLLRNFIVDRAFVTERSLPPLPRPPFRLGDSSDGKWAYALYGRYICATAPNDGQG